MRRACSFVLLFVLFFIEFFSMIYPRLDCPLVYLVQQYQVLNSGMLSCPHQKCNGAEHNNGSLKLYAASEHLHAWYIKIAAAVNLYAAPGGYNSTINIIFLGRPYLHFRSSRSIISWYSSILYFLLCKGAGEHTWVQKHQPCVTLRPTV